jgi:hypothetical protein
MKYLTLLIALYGIALSNCSLIGVNNNSSHISPDATPVTNAVNNPFKPRKTKKPEQVLIYADLTTSIKQEGIDRISEKLKQVLLNLPRDSFVSIRLVEKNLLGESPFPELQTPATCKMPESEIKREIVEAQKECKKKDEPYIKRVDEISERIKTVKPHVDVSCIMDTLESAHDFFKGKNKEKYDFRLIYFSDMIEQCNSNSIFVCGSKNQPKKADILAKIESGYNPNYNLASVVGDNVSIIITTNDNPNYNCLSLSEQKDIWSAIFSKTGYQEVDITTFNYSQEIPDALKGSD